MGLREALRLSSAPVAAATFTETEPVAASGTESTASDVTAPSLSLVRAQRVAIDIALSIGAVRKAMHVICGTLGAFALSVWTPEGERLPATDPRAAWLTQPDPTQTLQWTLTRTLSDLIWHDCAVWRISDRTLLGTPTAALRVHPSRVDAQRDPLDPDRVAQWIIDGRAVTNPQTRLIVFDGAGLGGLQRYGFELLDLYGKLQAAAGRYADAPHPHAILKNHGADLSDTEITELLDSWEAARTTRSVGYTNDVIDYDPIEGWSAKDLQLTEAREYAALDVARLFGLPAFAIDGTNGDSMTYGNIVDRRRDLLQSLTPWSAVLENTLSMDDRTGRPRGIAVPHGYTVRLDTGNYLDESPSNRATTWRTLIDAKIITPDEARRLDPTTRTIK